MHQVALQQAGIGFVLVALNPEDVNARLHTLGASNLLTANAGVLLLGLSTRAERSWQSVLALGLASVAFVGLVSGPLALATLHTVAA